MTHHMRKLMKSAPSNVVTHKVKFKKTSEGVLVVMDAPKHLPKKELVRYAADKAFAKAEIGSVHPGELIEFRDAFGRQNSMWVLGHVHYIGE